MEDRHGKLCINMEYAIIIILQVIGVGFSVMERISKIGDKQPTFTRHEIVNAFWVEDWDTLIVSGLVLALNLVAHYIVEHYTVIFLENDYAQLYGFGIALIMGYAGQRLIYKYMGSAEKFLDKKVDDRLK